MHKIRALSLLLMGMTMAVNANNLPPSQIPINSTNPQTIIWNLKDVDIRTVIEQVARATGKNFIVDPKVSGKITLISSQPLPAAELYQTFLSILQVNGYTAITSDKMIKITPLSDAKQFGIPLLDKLKIHAADEVVTQVIHANNIRVDKLIYVVQPMMPSFGSVSAYLPGNDLIVVGTKEIVNRVAQLVTRMDAANEGGVKVIALKHIPVQDAISIMDTLDKAELAKGERQFSIAADTHSNSIVLKGNQENIKKIAVVLAQLDVPGHNAMSNSRVIYLHYLKAKDLAPILNRMLDSNNTDTSTVATAPVQPTVAAAATQTNIPQKAFVQAEPNTNALIVKAAPADIQNITAIITKLDIRPAQVLVEAAIVEVSDTLLNQLGIDWRSVNDANLNPLPLRNALGVSIGFIHGGSLQAIVHALASEQNINILSTPSVVVMDNQLAKIEIGKTVSVKNSSYPGNAAGTGTTNPYTTYNREKVGLHLHVTPQITQGDTIQMLIDQANDSVEESTLNDPNKDPIFNNRDIKTTVMVDNKAILVLGGLISTESESSTQKIPVLGDIPGIGNLFQYKTRHLEKKNLMVFLQPRILRDAPDNQQVTDRKYNYMRQQQLLQKQKPASWINDRDSKVLPALGNPLPDPFKQE